MKDERLGDPGIHQLRHPCPRHPILLAAALYHHINIELLEEAFYELQENAAPGVDRLTWKDYEAKLERNLEDLHDRVQRGAYRPWGRGQSQGDAKERIEGS